VNCSRRRSYRRKLGSHGIPLLAADELVGIAGLNATTVLVRRVKQGVAEWYRIQLKAKTPKGLEEHAIAGFNNGRVPYSYIPRPDTSSGRGQGQAGTNQDRLAADPQAGRKPAPASAKSAPSPARNGPGPRSSRTRRW
jgi:hypothetical protein